MSTTVQEMYFRTEEQMLECEAWLPANMAEGSFVVLARGPYPDKEYFYLSIWFKETPMIVPFYDANAHLMFDGE